MNFFWVDVETTGLYFDKHDIVQLAGTAVINGEVKDSFNEFCQPVNWKSIEQGAVNVHGITEDMMKTFQTPKECLDKFITFMKQYNVKFVIAGFNVGFDKTFLSSFFTKHGRSEEFFELFELHTHDTFKRAKQVKAQLPTENLKLETLAKYFGIQIKAHDALSDISATIEVDARIGEILGENIEAMQVQQDDFVVPENLPEPARLHLHSMYGMHESIPDPDEWAQWCVENKVPGFSIVDHGYATSMFHMVDKDGPIRVPGVGLHFADNDDELGIYHVNAWATSTEGYYNLMKLSSLSFKDQRHIDGVIVPVLHESDIVNHLEGVCFGTADPYGKMGNMIMDGKRREAEQCFQKYIELFGDRLYAEFLPVTISHTYSDKLGFQRIKNNDCIEGGDLGRAYNRFIANMVDKYGTKYVISSGAHFIKKSDKLVQDCITKNAYDSGKCYNESYHAKTAKELFVDLKRQVGDWLTEERFIAAVDNSLFILDGANTISPDRSYHLPEIPIPKLIREKTDDYKKQTYYLLMQKIKEHGRWIDDPVYIARFKKELNVIMDNPTLNFIPYFLLYEDICAYARSKGILQGLARGSAGGSYIAFLLKITHLDPIVNKLPFERFLSFARIAAKSFPDFDCDFGNREPIIAYLKEKYGLGFAQICTLQSIKVKNAIKQAMWALRGRNRKDKEIEEVCKTIPDSPQGLSEKKFLYGYIDKEGEYHRGHIEDNEMLRNFFEHYPDVKNLVDRLIGLVNSVGRHASAYVISTLDLANTRVPINIMYDKAGNEIRVTQFDAGPVEASGLVKADILGVTTIEILDECMNLIKDRHGIDYREEDEYGIAQIYRLPEDPDVYADFYNRRTHSLFQFNTFTINSVITDFAPVKREDLSVLTAIMRPGAMDALMVNEELDEEDGVSASQYYIDVRNGKCRLSYIHPDLEKYVKETNGIFAYQEQIMEFLVDFAGYTLEESDQIRGAIAKKKREKMIEAFDRIRSAAHTNNWTEEQIKAVCDTVEAFSRYSFNRSHSRAYSELGYITGYFKNKHPLEWWAAVLSVENRMSNKEEKVRGFISLLRDKIIAPSFKNPSANFTIVGDKIAAPISAIKGIGNATVEELVNKGPFIDLDDFVNRIDHRRVNKGHFERIVQSRAADDMIGEMYAMGPGDTYHDARCWFLNDYKQKKKGSKVKLNETLLNAGNPIDIFLLEKEVNKCFNKSLMMDPEIQDQVATMWPELERTGNKNIPFKTPEGLYILSDLRVAEAMLKKGKGDIEWGMLMLFEGSHHKKITGKKSRKTYDLLEVTLSDGFSSCISSKWGLKKALGWPKNSIVLVKGTLKAGFREPVIVNINDMELFKEDKQ